MYNDLAEICSRPEPFSVYTADVLWTDEHISEQMLRFHLDDNTDLASRRSDFMERSVDWMVHEFQIGAGVRIIDFGCGPGHYTTRLAKTGAMVTGIDFSPRSLAHATAVAEQEHLSINYIRQNYLEFETTEKYDLIIMIFCDFCALSPSQRQRMLRKFGGLLAAGGHILLDVHTCNTYDRQAEKTVFGPDLMNGFWSKNPYYGFLNTFKYPGCRVTLDKYTIVEAERRWSVYNWLQYFDSESIGKEFSAAGLNISAFYGDVAGAPLTASSPDMAVVAVAGKHSHPTI